MFQSEAMRNQVGRNGKILVIGILFLKIIDVIPLGLKFFPLKRSKILPQVNIIVVVSVGQVNQFVGEMHLQILFGSRRNTQHTQGMSVSQRILLYQLDRLLQIPFAYRTHVGNTGSVFNPETDQQLAVNNRVLTFVKKAPAAHIRKRKITITIIPRKGERLYNTPVVKGNWFKWYIHVCFFVAPIELLTRQ